MTRRSFRNQTGVFVPPGQRSPTVPAGFGGYADFHGHTPLPTGSMVQEGAGDKLDALVRVDVECEQVRIGVRGSVTTRNVTALYILARRANALALGLEIVLDLKRATVQPEALDELLECSRARQLPLGVDPDQSECRMRITPPATPARNPAGLALAA